MSQKPPSEASETARALVAVRWAKTTPEQRKEIARHVASHGAGRKRTDAPRCPCGAMTLKLAQIRANKEGTGLGHEPGCSFYRAQQ